MLNIFPKNDPQQSLRLRRFFMALGSYLMWYVLISYYYYNGHFRMTFTQMVTVYSVFLALNLAVYITIRTGLNKRYYDPSLTVPQMIIGTVGAMVTVYFTNEGRGVMLMLYLVVFVFGVFRFNVLQFLQFAMFSLASYGVVILGLYVNHPDKVDLRLEFLQLIVLAAVLPWFSVVGGYISRLRTKLNRINTDLTGALAMIEKLAVRDDLTGVFNRRKMIEILRREKALADRSGTAFSICLFDLDYFKHVNDTYGHLVGDEVLRTLTKEVQKELRASDSISRYGGEEFVVILSNTDLDGSLEYAERIRKRTEEIVHPELHDHRNVTISIGVVSYTSDESIESLLARADKALYAAKANGRNRIEFLEKK